MTRREILEKNWKDFRVSTGLEYEPMSDKAYEFMENAMEQYAELRLGDVINSVFNFCDHLNTYDGMEEIRFDFMIQDFIDKSQ
jgi:histidinol phosphatase-like PHP family hydrolase